MLDEDRVSQQTNPSTAIANADTALKSTCCEVCAAYCLQSRLNLASVDLCQVLSWLLLLAVFCDDLNLSFLARL